MNINIPDELAESVRQYEAMIHGPDTQYDRVKVQQLATHIAARLGAEIWAQTPNAKAAILTYNSVEAMR